MVLVWSQYSCISEWVSSACQSREVQEKRAASSLRQKEMQPRFGSEAVPHRAWRHLGNRC